MTQEVGTQILPRIRISLASTSGASVIVCGLIEESVRLSLPSSVRTIGALFRIASIIILAISSVAVAAAS